MKFTDEHDWLTLDGDVATIGVTAHASAQLGDFVSIRLPKVGAKLRKGDRAAVAESVKVASDIRAPLDGEVVEVNDAVDRDPALVNFDALGRGWLYRMRLANAAEFAELIDESAYRNLIA